MGGFDRLVSRLIGAKNISPEMVPPNGGGEDDRLHRTRWPRSDILALIGVIIAAVSSVAAVIAIPELHDTIFRPAANDHPLVPHQTPPLRERPSIPTEVPEAPVAPSPTMGHWCVVGPPNRPESVRDMMVYRNVGELCYNDDITHMGKVQ